MNFKLRPRPAGEAARVVFQEYDIPLDPALEPANKSVLNNGSDWSLGTPSSLDGGKNVHDAWADLDGNLWFTNASPSPEITIGKLDPQTGAVKYFKVDGLNGLAAGAHGMTRDEQGNIWFNVAPTTIPNHGGLARLDPRTGKSGTGGAVTVYVDGKARSGLRRPMASCASTLRLSSSPSSSRQLSKPYMAPASLTALLRIATATAGGRKWRSIPAIGLIMRAFAMHRAAIVPDYEIAGRPFMAVDEFRSGCLEDHGCHRTSRWREGGYFARSPGRKSVKPIWPRDPKMVQSPGLRLRSS